MAQFKDDAYYAALGVPTPTSLGLREQAEEPEQPGLLSDLGRGVAAGAAAVGSGAGFALRKLGAEDVGAGLTEQANNAADYWLRGVSRETADAMGRDYLEDTEGGFGVNWRRVGMDVAQSIPATAAGLGAGALATKGLAAAAGASRGAIATAARTGGQAAARPLATRAKIAAGAGYGAGEAGIASMQSGAATFERVMALPEEELFDIPEYHELAARYGKEGAHKRLADITANEAAGMTAASTFAFSAPFGAFMDRIVRGLPLGTTRARSIGKGAAMEALQEAPQSASEAIAQNLAIQRHIDPEQSLTEGAAEAALGGSLAGGVLGGTFGIASPLQPIQQAPDVDTAAAEASRVAQTGLDPNMLRAMAERNAIDIQQAFPEQERLEIPRAALATPSPAAVITPEQAAAQNQRMLEVAALEPRKLENQMFDLPSGGVAGPKEGEISQMQARRKMIRDHNIPLSETPKVMARLTPSRVDVRGTTFYREADVDSLSLNAADIDVQELPPAQKVTVKPVSRRRQQAAAEPPAPIEEIVLQSPEAAREELVQRTPTGTEIPVQVEPEEPLQVPPAEGVQVEEIPLDTAEGRKRAIEATPVRYSKRGPVDETEDGVLEAIAKLGGISREDAESEGEFDSGDYRKRGRFFGPNTVFRQGGRSLDDMAQALAEYGYPTTENGNPSINALLGTVRRALGGQFVPSVHIAGDAAARAAGAGRFEPVELEDSIDDLSAGYEDEAVDWAHHRARAESIIGEDAVEDIVERVATQYADASPQEFANQIEIALEEAVNAETEQGPEPTAGPAGPEAPAGPEGERPDVDEEGERPAAQGERKEPERSKLVQAIDKEIDRAQKRIEASNKRLGEGNLLDISTALVEGGIQLANYVELGALSIAKLVAEFRLTESAWRNDFKNRLKASGYSKDIYTKDLEKLYPKAEEEFENNLKKKYKFLPSHSAVALRTGKKNLNKYGLRTVDWDNKSDRHNVRQIAQALELMARDQHGGIPRNDYSEEVEKLLAKYIVQEVKFESRPEAVETSGVGWYTDKFQASLDIFGEIFPELKTDKDARDVMTAIVAITSDGARVAQNFENAADGYENYRRTGTIKIDAEHIRDVDGNIAKLNDLLDKHGPAGMTKILMKEDTLANVRKIAEENGIGVKELSSSYGVDADIPLAAAYLGPKLGAFYSNLMGKTGYLTMDRWWSRTINRYRGQLVPRVKGLEGTTEGNKKVGIASFKELIGRPDISDQEALIYVTQYRDQYGDKKGQDYKKPKAGTVDPMTGKPANTKTELESLHDKQKSGNTIWKAAVLEIEDAPFGARDRDLQRRAALRAQKSLKRAGLDYTIADIQAILWYFEKRLYGDLGAADVVDISYVEAAQRVLSGRLIGLTLEAVPSVTSGEMSWIHTADPSIRSAYTKDALALVRDGGKDLIAEKIGADVVSQTEGAGSFEGAVNPNVITTLYARKKGKGEVVTDHATLYANLWGAIFTQDASSWHRPTNVKGKGEAWGVRLNLDAEITHDQLEAAYNELIAKAKDTKAKGEIDFTVMSPTEIRVINFLYDGKPMSGLQKGKFIKLIENWAKEDIPMDVRAGEFSAETSYIANDWKENPNGEGYLGGIDSAGRSDLHGWISDRRQAVADLQKEYTERYAKERAPGVRFSVEAGAERDVERRGGEADAAGLQGPGLPVREDGKVPLTHWGRQAGLQSLDPDFFGSAAAARAETGRQGPDFINRTYYALPGYKLESVVASNAGNRYFTTVDQADLYDYRGDPDGLQDALLEEERKGTLYQRFPGLQPVVTTNAYETAIRDAGYKGYWTTEPLRAVAMFESLPVTEVTDVPMEDRNVAGWDEKGDLRGERPVERTRDSRGRFVAERQTPEQVQAGLEKGLGKSKVRALIRKGLLDIRATGEEGVQGYWDGSKAVLIASNIDPGTEVGVLLHELGEHAGFEPMLGDRYKNLVARFDELLESGDEAAVRAAGRVPDDTAEQFIASERLAYLIEDVANASPETVSDKARALYKRVLAAIRAWFYQTAGYRAMEAAGLRMQLTPDDITALARRAVDYVASEAGVPETPRLIEGVPTAEAAQLSGKAAPTGSAAFKRWFGKSQVVDENKEPLVVAHATNAESFYEFKTSGLSAHFGSVDAAQAREKDLRNFSEKVVGRDPGEFRTEFVYLKIENPLDMPDLAGLYETERGELIEDDEVDARIDEFYQDDPDNPERPFPMAWENEGDLQTWLRANEIIDGEEFFDVQYDVDAAVELLKEKGYDGIRYENEIESPGSLSWIPFDPSQIKSATENIGEFSPESPDIRYSKAVPTRPGLTPEQEAALEKGRFGARHRKTAAEWKEDLTSHAITRLRQGFVDQYASLKDILGSTEAWMQAQLTAGTVGALEATVEYGTPYLKEGVLQVKTAEDSLKKVLEPLGSEIDLFLSWIAGNRARRLSREGRERLFSGIDIDALASLDRGTMEDGRGRRAVYAKALSGFEKINNAVNQIAVETGLLAAEEAAVWKDQGFYVPFYRMMEDEKSRGPGGMGSGLTKQTATKRLTGADIPLDDLLGNALMNWQHIMTASMKNQAASTALAQADSIGLAERLTKKGDVYVNEDGEVVKPGKDSVWVRKDGKQVWYKLDASREGQLVLDSLLALNWAGLSGRAMKTLRFFKRALTLGVTISPEFRVANLLRDSIHSIAVVPMSKNIPKNLKTGWMATDKKSESYAQMLASGALFGASGYIHGGDPEAVRRVVNRGVDRATILTPRKVKKLWDWYEDTGARMENINRAAAYQKALESDDTSLLEAAFESRDVLDFSRTGSFEAVRAIAQTVPFLNARLQGLDKLGRAAMNPAQRKQFGVVVGVYAMASLALYLAMKDDDDYKEAPQWERDAYHLFKFPGSDVMIRIPRPFEVGAIATIWERAWEQILDDEVHGALFAERLGHALTETFGFSIVPQAFQPLLEIWGNRNSFTGRRIETQAMQNLSPERRKRAWTSETAIATSEGLQNIPWERVQLSPVQVEHLVNGYFGWAGSQVLGLTDWLVSRPARGAPEPPAREWDEYLLAKRFARFGVPRSTKYVEMFYDRLDEAKKAFSDIRDAREAGDLVEAETIREANRNKLAKRKWLNRQSRAVSKLTKQIEAITARKDLDAASKRDMIDILQARKNLLIRRAVEVTEDAFTE